MQKQEYELYKQASNVSDIFLTDFPFPEKDRTLIWGYTLERDSFHVYIQNGELHRVIYNHQKKIIDYVHGDYLPAEQMQPSKQAYPCATDLLVSFMMMRIGYELPFTSFNEEREEKAFHGLTVSELEDDSEHGHQG